jgi:hypothetical protein
LRDRALREAHTNNFNLAYRRCYAKLREAHPWAGHYDPSTISHACWLHDNLSDVLRWREGLAANQREAWTTPRVVHQNYERMTRIAAKKEAGAEVLSPQAAMKQELIAAIERADAAERKLAQADSEGSLFNLKADTGPMIAKVMLSHIGDDKATVIAKALLAGVKARKAKKAHAG